MEEKNLPILPKKVWSLLRLFYYMLRKGVSKNKLWLDLNLMMKRAKIAGKALQNLLFHHHHNWAAFTLNENRHSPPCDEYEFSCTNSPSTSIYTFHNKKQNKQPVGLDKVHEDIDMLGFNAAVFKAMEMIHSESVSPALPGFGRSPVVRQLRVTDSPFPLSNVDEDSRVDEAAEEFIRRFYNDLRQQKRICNMTL